MQAVTVPVGSDLYAVPVDWVQQVLVAPPTTVLVTALAPVMGLFNLRGEIVPLLDTAALLGIGDLDTATFAVVLRGSNGPVGLAATAMPERVSLDGPPTTSMLAGTSGTYSVNEAVVVLLDPDVLLVSAGLTGSEPLTSAPAPAAA
jgi:purine-binding chemotaxis protein CheW